MNDMLIIVPSRGRPENIQRLFNVWPKSVDILVAVDEDDQKLDEYLSLRLPYPLSMEVCEIVGPRLRLGGILNELAKSSAPYYEYIGFMGDDHLPKTEGWEEEFSIELEHLGVGIVYGNDLLQGERLPTAAVMTSNIIQTLGYMSPPVLTHMYIDDAWLAWGRGIDSITYMPEVIIEHIHPAANKTAQDSGYEEANSYMQADKTQWESYVSRGLLEEDIQKLWRLKYGVASVS